MSSHLLAEVAQTVDDVVIIANGRLVTQSSLADLTRRSQAGVRVRTPQAEALRSALAGRGHRRRNRREPTQSWRSTQRRMQSVCGRRRQAVIYEMTSERFDLEDIFLELTLPKERPMNNLIRAELLKMRTTRTFWWSAAAALAFVPVSIALAMSGTGTGVAASLDSVSGFRNVIAAASSGGVVCTPDGIMLTAGEYRFNTVTSTFLITPDRKRVIGAKIAAASLVGLAIAVLASLLTLAIALPWLSSRHVDIAAHSTDIVLVLLGGIAATAISGMVGVGIGALVTNQTLAVTATLDLDVRRRGLVVGLAPDFGRWLPGAPPRP